MHRFVNGWFPPEARNAVMHLCHATRTEALASLFAVRAKSAALPFGELRKLPFVYQDYQSVHPATICARPQAMFSNSNESSDSFDGNRRPRRALPQKLKS